MSTINIFIDVCYQNSKCNCLVIHYNHEWRYADDSSKIIQKIFFHIEIILWFFHTEENGEDIAEAETAEGEDIEDTPADTPATDTPAADTPATDTFGGGTKQKFK